MVAAAAPRVLIFQGCAIFSSSFFSRVLLKVFVVHFWAFLQNFHDFGHFLDKYCVLIFQTLRFVCAIL